MTETPAQRVAAPVHRIRRMSGRDPHEEHRVATPLELLCRMGMCSLPEMPILLSSPPYGGSALDSVASTTPESAFTRASSTRGLNGLVT